VTDLVNTEHVVDKQQNSRMLCGIS